MAPDFQKGQIWGYGYGNSDYLVEEVYPPSEGVFGKVLFLNLQFNTKFIRELIPSDVNDFQWFLKRDILIHDVLDMILGDSP